MTSLRISRTHFPVTALGPGRRFGVWVQGCPLACAGCMSLDTWDPTTGRQMAVADLVGLWRAALAEGADGLTISGGEPFAQPEALRGFLIEADRARAGHAARPDILVYTGYEESELDDTQQAAAALADVLVTGRYDPARPTDLIWRGSANQHMVMRTELGRRRYAAYANYAPERPTLQVEASSESVWIIGTPRRGTLSRLERTLRRQGMDPAALTWRPRSSD